MLMTTICSLDDQGVAEIMREVCKKLGCDEALTLTTVDIALERFQKTGSRAQAINAGSAWVSRVKRSGQPERRRLDSASNGPALSVHGAGRFTRAFVAVFTILTAAAAFATAIVLVWGAL